MTFKDFYERRSMNYKISSISTSFNKEIRFLSLMAKKVKGLAILAKLLVRKSADL